MAATPDMLRVLGSHQNVFNAEEPLLSAIATALPKGDPDLDPAKMMRASTFPLAAKITIGLTRKRLVIFKSGWGNKVGGLLGEVPLERVADVEIVWNRKLAILAFGMNDAPPVVMRAVNADAAEHFRLAFLRLRGRL